MRRVLLLSLASLVAACSSQGANGDKGLVRFSFVGNYAGTDANSPVATNSTLRILLQHPKAVSIGTDSSTFVELNLTAKALDGGSDPEVFPTGISEYGVFFTKSGTYELDAMQGSTTLDSLTVKVEDPDALAFASEAVVTTQLDNCSTTDTVPVNSLDLAENQIVTIDAQPRNGSTALIGLPALTADATNADITTIASSYAMTELNLIVTPKNFGQDATVTVQDLGNKLTGKLTIKTHAGRATGTCP